MKIFKYIFILILLSVLAVNPVNADGTYYLVRHAEKQNDGTPDPHLTKQGQARAALLAKQLSAANITKIYSTDYYRTNETVQPLAELFGLSVELYSPNNLEQFAAMLKTQTGQIVIAGHSNTTPSLTALLSGQAIDGIDHSEYENLYQVVSIDDKTRLNRFKIFPIEPRPLLAAVTLDSTRFSSGSATFNMLFNGDVVGQSIHTLTKNQGHYRLDEKTIMKKRGIDYQISSTVNKDTLAPISMSMTGAMGDAVDINLNWQDTNPGVRVQGYSEIARADHHTQGRLKIDQQFSQHRYERTSLIMLAHLLNVSKDRKQSIQWFNAYNGFSREILISDEGEEDLTVPAGAFSTYKILYNGGDPSYVFYISKGKRPQIVRMEIPATPWTYELVKPR